MEWVHNKFIQPTGLNEQKGDGLRETAAIATAIIALVASIVNLATAIANRRRK